jgi:hypothetical protein
MFNFNTLGVNLVLNEKISDVHVTRAFGAGTPSVFLEEDRAGVVLVQDRLINIHALAVEEMCSLNQLWHNVMNTNFGLVRAPSNQFLLA